MITVNLFDANFRQSPCSVAWQESTHIHYVRDLPSFDGVTLFTDGYLFDGTVDEVDCLKKVGWLREPRCLWPLHYEQAPLVVNKFDYILTYCGRLLGLSGFRFVPYGGVWIDREHWGIREKSKLASMLYGSKVSTRGHRLRHHISDVIVDLVDFYGYRGTPTDYGPATKLQVLGDYQFSIVVETCRENNLFTEILLDCFAVGTIPIFWGAPNISTFFNADGILSFNTVSELLTILDRISPELYQMMLPAARENLELTKSFAVTEDWMFENGVLT